MKVYVKNKLISIGGSSEVVNDLNEPVYKIDGQVFSITKKKRIYDMDNKFLYLVRNKYWRMFVRSALIYDAEGNKIAKVKKKFWSMTNKFIVQGYKDEISVDGELFSRKMPVSKNGQVVGSINRESDLFQDAFCIEAEPEEIPFLVALTIAIDNIFDEERKDRRK